MKKEIFFAFGTDESYFFSSAPSCRQKGFDDILKRPAIKRSWVARSPQSGMKYQLFLGDDGDREYTVEHGGELKNRDPKLKAWLQKRACSSRRLVFGPEKEGKLAYVAWVPFAGHICSPVAAKSVLELANLVTRLYTSIRIVALGVGDTYVIIWEDGTIRVDKGEDVSFVALNPSRAGDYFIYFDNEQLAIFQVSEAFGNDIEEVLKAEGVRSQAIVRRRVEIITPIPLTIVPPERASDFLHGLARSVGIEANLVGIRLSIAGLAACSVM